MIIYKNNLTPIPENIGSLAILCAIPTVNGFITAVVNPIPAPIKTIAVPVITSYPSASARWIYKRYIN